MLRWAARGVAMGHAPEAVRAAADEVTGTIADDGVVAVDGTAVCYTAVPSEAAADGS